MRLLAYGLALALSAAACGSPQLAACQLGAVRVLPLDPDQLTIGDLRDVTERLRACTPRPGAPDGGPP